MTVFTAQLGHEHQVGYSRIRSLGWDFSLLSFPFTCFSYLFSQTNHNLPFACFAVKEHVAPRISLVNV